MELENMSDGQLIGVLPDTEYKLRPGMRIFLQELVNCAAVVEQVKASVPDCASPYARGVMRTAAILLSLHHGVSVNEIEDAAYQRAKEILRTGQDWRRELRLFQSHIDFNQD